MWKLLQKKKQQLLPLQLVFQTIMIQLLKVTVKVIMLFGSFHRMFHKLYYSITELVCINIKCEFCSYLNPSASL